MTFKESLKKHLHERNWTRSELEKKAGLGERALVAYMENESDPTAGRLLAISQALGVSMEKAYDWDAKTPEGVSEKAFRLAQKIDGMNEKKIEIIEHIIDLFCDKID